jgi:AcrR family transcriptional regulator
MCGGRLSARAGRIARVRADQEAVPPRREQERSRVTRQRLMEATVECLLEYGWSGTTTTVVAERAGVSRGAQLHHYPTRAELVVAAVQHVGAARDAELVAAAEAVPPGPRRTETVLTMLADLYSGPLFQAALELWVAARTDPALHAVTAPLEIEVGRRTHRTAIRLLHADERKPGVREAVQATLDLVRGLGLARILSDDQPRRTHVLAQWAAMLDAVLNQDS